MDSKKDETSHPTAARVLISTVKALNSFIDRVFGLSLFLCVMLMGILMVLPVIGVWTIYAIAQYLPFPFGAVLIWGMALALVTFAAATDYARST
jgi:hypothetical protein